MIYEDLSAVLTELISPEIFFMRKKSHGLKIIPFFSDYLNEIKPVPSKN
jgi:hypothetical protein